jgi:Actin like proteins N terminal domain
MEPIVRALDVGFGHTKFVSGMDGSEVRCAHFPSVAYPTESDETTDPMGGRRKTAGIPIDGLIYEVGPDVHLAADIFNAKQMPSSGLAPLACCQLQASGTGPRSRLIVSVLTWFSHAGRAFTSTDWRLLHCRLTTRMLQRASATRGPAQRRGPKWSREVRA